MVEPVHLVVVMKKCESIGEGSAEARLAWSGRFYVPVKVLDNTARSRLAARLQAHWWTDAVEITVDPRSRSEGDLQHFKLGTAGNRR